MRKIVLAFLCILSYNSCVADEISVIGHGFAKHAKNYNFNESLRGAAFRYESGKYALQAGIYHNSVNKDTTYVGLDWSPVLFNVSECLNISAGLYAGAATGYKYTVTPMAGVQAAAKCKNVFVRVRAMPDLFYNSKAVGSVEVGIVLKRF